LEWKRVERKKKERGSREAAFVFLAESDEDHVGGTYCARP